MTDSRGPLRTVTEIVSTPSAHLVLFAECGHRASFTRHHTAPVIGEQCRCLDCRREADLSELRAEVKHLRAEIRHLVKG